MSEGIRKVYGSRYYKIIRFDFLPDAKGSTNMHFHAEENPLTAIKFALNYNDFLKLGLKFNLTSRDLLLKESRALLSVSISENPRLYAEYFKYINKNRTSRAVLDYYFEAIDFPVYDDFRLYERLRSYYSAFDLQLQQSISRFSYFGLGQQYIYSKIKTEETPSLVYNGHNHYWHSYLNFELNNANLKYFPTKGWNVKAQAGYIYNQNPEFEYSYNDSVVNSDSLAYNYDDYFRIFINANHYSELSPKFSWSQNLTVAYIIENDPYIADRFVVGGINEIIRNQVPFAGLNESEVRTGSIASLQMGLQYKLAKKTFITGRINAALYDFQGAEFSKLTTDDNLLTGYGLTFGYNSVIGPLEFTVMYCDQDAKMRNNINIGFRF